MKLTIVRHWESETNLSWKLAGHYNTPLTESWIQMAVMTWVELKNKTFDVAFSSDLDRAVDTASCILKHHDHLELIIDESLRERDFGEMSWKFKSDVSEILWVGIKDIHNEMHKRWISETDEHLKLRAKGFIDKLIKNHMSNSILIINHWWMMRALMTELLLTDKMWMIYKNCSITELVIDTDWRKIVRENDISHLN